MGIEIKNRRDEPVNAILISSPPPVKSAAELKKLLRHNTGGDKDV
jgi:hypothetical protein